MKSKTAINRKKNRRKNKNKTTKAAALVEEYMEQETLDSLDPIKNASNNNLFIFDNNLPHKNGAGDNKMIKNKTTWAEKTLAHKGLGIVFPLHKGKDEKEKRKLPEVEKEKIEQKAKRMKRETEMKSEHVMEVDSKSVPIVKETTKSNKVYDLWGASPAPPKNPKQSFIEEIINPKQKEFLFKALETNLPAVVLPTEAESYRPTDEVHKAIKGKNRIVEEKLQKDALEKKIALKKLTTFKEYFPPIDKSITKKDGEEEEEEEEGEPIRALPKRHKTQKEARKIQEKKRKRATKLREEEFQRNQREIYRIPEILKTIEDEDKEKESESNRKKAHLAKRVDQPITADGKKIKQPKILSVADVVPQRLRALKPANPVKDRIQSLKNRGLMSADKPKNKHVKHFRMVEPQSVKSAMREDEEKYLYPMLDKLNAKK